MEAVGPPGSVIPRTKSGSGGDSPSCWGCMPPSLPQQLLPRCSARPWCPSEGLRPEPKPEQREGPAAPLPVLTAEKLPAECSHLTALPESRLSSASEEPIASSLGESYRVQGLKSAHSWPVEQAEWGQHTHVQQRAHEHPFPHPA